MNLKERIRWFRKRVFVIDQICRGKFIFQDESLPEVVQRLVPHPECEVVVSSYGGVMSTQFIDWLSQYRRVNINCQNKRDAYFLKHTCYPPVSTNRHLRLVYLFDDPILSLISIFRRNFQGRHWSNITGKDIAYATTRKMGNLESYLNSDINAFPLQQHFHNWQVEPTQFPILFIRASTMWNYLDLVQSFLGLPDEAMASFPKKKKRESLYADLNPDLRNKLHQLYGDLQEEVERQPDTYIRQPDWFA